MVRLKASRDELADGVVLFQFHYGSIKSAHTLYSYDSRQLGFNSTMVRLKATGIPYVSLMLAKFQFHYGSIKSITKYCITEYF